MPALNETRGRIHADGHVEALVVHVTVEVEAGIVLAVRDSIQMMLENVNYHRQHRTLLHVLHQFVLGNWRFFVNKETRDLLLQNLDAFRHNMTIFLKSLQKPPTAVAAIVSGTVPAVQKIGEQAIPKHRSRCHKDTVSILVAAGRYSQTSQRNHAVATPRSHVARAEVCNAGGEGGQLPERLQHAISKKLSI